MIIPDLLEKSINLVDIGAVGNPPPHWLPLKDKIHLFGFEPNKDECARLNHSIAYTKSLNSFHMPLEKEMKADLFTLLNTMNVAPC